jgi:hypothetical protein
MTLADKIRQMPNLPPSEVAARVGCSISYVCKTRRLDRDPESIREVNRRSYHNNAKHGGFGRGKAPVDEIKRRRAMGHSFRRIADDLGVGYGAVASTVRRYCNEASP